MKNTIYIALIFIGLYACEPEPYNAEIKYLISNASNHDIELTFFHMPETKDTIFFLFPDSIIEYNSAIKGTADSAYLNFDNVRQIIYRWNDGKYRNILDENNNIFTHGDTITDFTVSYYINLYYTLTDDDVEVIDGIIQSCSYNFFANTYGTNLKIPQTLDGQMVTGIQSASDETTGIFAEKKIKQLMLPPSLQAIGNYSFIANELKIISIPPNVSTIGIVAFGNNTIDSIIFEGANLQIIDSAAFSGNNLTTVSIPNSTTSIGSYSFSNNSITNITFESGSMLSSIGSYAFVNNQLTELKIPNNVVSIEAYAFLSNAISSLTFEAISKLELIGDFAFTLNSLDTISIPASVISIGENAFWYNGLSSLSFETGSKIKSIGSCAFQDNALTSIIIPNTVVEIGNYAFSNNSLSTITFEAGSILQELKSGLFRNNLITSVDIPDSVTKIGTYAFRNNKITSLIIPKQVKMIDAYAFTYNTITSISIPSNVITLGKGAFQSTALTEVLFEENSQIKNIYESAFAENSGLAGILLPTNANIGFINYLDGNGNSYLQGDSITDFTTNYYSNVPYVLTDDDVVVVDGIIQSCSYDFSNTNILIPQILDNQIVEGIKNAEDSNSGVFSNKGITIITLPETLKSIGNYSFYSNNLKYITIPDSVRIIGKSAFYENLLTGIKFADTELLDTIGSYSFSSNRLKSVNIPEGVTMIESCAFSDNWPNLTSMTLSNTVKSIGNSAFTTNSLMSVEIPASVESIGNSAFLNNDLTSLIFEEGSRLKTIGSQAFMGGYKSNELTEVAIPDSVTTIGDGTFKYNALTDVVLSKSLTSIGESAFEVNNLTSVFIPNSVTEIGEAAFRTNSLTSVVFEDSCQLQTIGVSTFWENEITVITIPKSITSIGERAFGVNSISRIEFEYGCKIQSIGRESFKNNKIDSLLILKSVRTIDDGAFENNSLTVVEFEPKSEIRSLGINVFFQNSGLGSIAMPVHAMASFLEYKDGSDNSYKAGDAISDFVTNYYTAFSASAPIQYTLTDEDVVVIDGIIVSCSYDFAFNLGGTELTIPDTLDGQMIIGIKSVTEFYNGVFYNKNMTKLTLPSSIQTIGSSAFRGNNLTSIEIPDSVTIIEDGAFSYNNLTSVTFGENSQLQTVGSDAFYRNDIVEISIPENVFEIEAFAFCSNALTTITIPASVIAIGNSAFNGNNLQNVSFEDNSLLQSIGSDAFNYNNLVEILLPTHPTLSNMGWEDENGETYSTGDTITDFSVSYSIPSGFQISYVLYGGTNHVDNPDIYSKLNGITEFETPTLIGYAFSGWFSDSVFSSEVTSIPSGCLGDTVLYAKWKINKYLVSFFDYDNSIIKTDSVEYGGNATAPHSLERAGYTFIGWDVDFYNVASDLIVTAQYEINTSIEEPNLNSVLIYPTIVTDILHIECLSRSSVLAISSVSGVNVYLKTIGEYAMVDCRSFDTGIYFVKVQSGNEVVTKQVVIK